MGQVLIPAAVRRVLERNGRELVKPQQERDDTMAKFQIVPVQAPDEGPCFEVPEEKAEFFAVYDDGGLIDLYETREEAEQATSQLNA